MPLKRALLWSALLAGVLFVAVATGCNTAESDDVAADDPAAESTQGDPADGEEAAEACALLTADDLTDELGEAYFDAPDQSIDLPGFASACSWKTDTGKLTTLALKPKEDSSRAAESFATEKGFVEREAGVPPIDQPGIGDDAYWVADPGSRIEVLSGDQVFRITVRGSIDGKQEKAGELALKALEKL